MMNMTSPSFLFVSKIIMAAELLGLPASLQIAINSTLPPSQCNLVRGNYQVYDAIIFLNWQLAT
jgi:hypothetical protein